MKIILFIMFFLLLGMFFIISKENLLMRNPDARVELRDLYSGWLKQLAVNSGNLAGNVIRLDWLPEE